jgi:hypothetical protein
MSSQIQSLPYPIYTTSQSISLTNLEEEYIIYNSDTLSYWKYVNSDFISRNAILQDKDNDTYLTLDNNNDGNGNYLLLSSNHVTSDTIFKINNGSNDILDITDEGHFTKTLYLDNNLQIDSNYSIKFNYSSSYSSISALKELTNTDIGFVLGSNSTYFGQQFLRYRWNGSLQNNISNSLNPIHFKSSGLSRYIGGWDVSTNSTAIITRTTSGGIDFTTECLATDIVTINGTNYTILSVDSSSQITLTTPFPTTGTYRITFPQRELLMINSLGYVGIGTINPTYKLEVSGSIKSDNITASNLISKKFIGTNISGSLIETTSLEIKTLFDLEVTVGTGGDYTTFELALAANKYKLKLVSNITLSANIILPFVNIYLNLNSYTISYEAYNFTVNSTNRFYINGDCSTNFTIPFNNAVLNNNLINGNLSVTGNNANILNPFITGNLTNSGTSIIVSNARVTGTDTDSGTLTIKWEIN